MKQLTATLAFMLCVACTLFLFSGVAVAEPRYVGNEGCKCHKLEIADWEISRHNRKLFDLLKPGKKRVEKKKAGYDPEKDYTTDKKCLKCHTTGYEKEGGFASLATTPDLVGVGCEMCHGPGGEYRNLHKRVKPPFTRAEATAQAQLYSSEDKKVCNSCHAGEDRLHARDKKPTDLDKAFKEPGLYFHEYYKQEKVH